MSSPFYRKEEKYTFLVWDSSHFKRNIWQRSLLLYPRSVCFLTSCYICDVKPILTTSDFVCNGAFWFCWRLRFLLSPSHMAVAEYQYQCYASVLNQRIWRKFTIIIELALLPSFSAVFSWAEKWVWQMCPLLQKSCWPWQGSAGFS